MPSGTVHDNADGWARGPLTTGRGGRATDDGPRPARIRWARGLAAAARNLTGVVLVGALVAGCSSGSAPGAGASPSSTAVLTPTVPADTSAPVVTIPTETAAPLTPAKTTPPQTPKPTTTSGNGDCERTLPAYPVLAPGATGPAVRALQCFLGDAGFGPVPVTGSYDARTKAAVAKVEATFEGPAPQPGRVDAGFWVLVISRSLGSATLASGAKGRDVRTLQRALRAAGGTLEVDGTFGPQTKRVVERFQEANRIGVDGVVGDETLFLLKSGATIG